MYIHVFLHCMSTGGALAASSVITYSCNFPICMCEIKTHSNSKIYLFVMCWEKSANLRVNWIFLSGKSNNKRPVAWQARAQESS